LEWSDEGIVMGVRRHGEANVLLELMTRAHGRHLGLVRGGRSTRMQAVLQPGNGVAVTWRARLEDHLGAFAVEGTDLRAARLIGSPPGLYGLGMLGHLVRLLPEREANPGLFDALRIVVEALDDPNLAAPLLIRFELAILSELGVGLDLTCCAVTGAREGLVYVSPKSGRAVSAAAGEAWKDRLLALPRFLADGQGRSIPDPGDLAAGFALTGYFLTRHVLDPRGIAMPDVRAALIASVASRDCGEEGRTS
jgi:DNA repair protein RecO (recombination protein O)